MASKSAESYMSSNCTCEQLELDASDYYTLVMTDVTEDGLCCDYGRQGYFLLQIPMESPLLEASMALSNPWCLLPLEIFPSRQA